MESFGAEIDGAHDVCAESRVAEVAEMNSGNISVPSQLPEGWVPAGAFVHVLAHRDEGDECWESVIPEFSIAGMGASPDEAVANAIELLDDYLLLCAAEGKSFSDAIRPFGWQTRVVMFADVVAAAARMIRWDVRHRGSRIARPRRSERYKVPLRLVGVH